MKSKISMITLSALVLNELFVFPLTAEAGRNRRVAARAFRTGNKRAATNNNSVAVVNNIANSNELTTTQNTETVETARLVSTNTVSNEDGTVTVTKTFSDGNTETTVTNEDGTELSEEQIAARNTADLTARLANAEALNVVKTEFAKALTEASSACSGIEDDLDIIKGWATATTVSSGLGTLAAGGALAVGIAKGVADKRIENSQEIALLKSELTQEEVDSVKNQVVGFKKIYEEAKESSDTDTAEENFNKMIDAAKKIDELYGKYFREVGAEDFGNPVGDGVVSEDILDKEYNALIDNLKAGSSLNTDDLKTQLASYDAEKDNEVTLQAKVDEVNARNKVQNAKDEKTSKTLGNVRTGLMAGATATSGVSTLSSFVSSGRAKTLVNRMAACNAKIEELKIIKAKFEAEDFSKDDATYKLASNISEKCSPFDVDNMKKVATSMTASGIVSAIGVGTAGAGTVTSVLANTDKTRNDNSEIGKKKEKALNLTTNILAGVTAGTSGASTVLSATAIAKVSKDADMAKECLDAINSAN